MKFSKAIAYPGLPIIFAEGYFIVEGRRFSSHSSIGAALTTFREGMRTETTVAPYEFDPLVKVDGIPLEDSRGAGMLHIIEEFMMRAKNFEGIRVDSKNLKILSGSSDSGCTALVTALNDFYKLDLPREELLSLGLYGSETVFRSLYGGLSEYRVRGEEVSVQVLATAKELSDVVVFAVPFAGSRFSADEIHGAVVDHPEYDLRGKTVNARIKGVRKCVGKGDMHGLFELMEEDARTVHKMFEDVGRKVISSRMKSLCAQVESWRKEGLKSYWNVAGGRQVYIFCLKEEARKL
ncbi:MAG: hypothetical protein ABH834_00165, partial [Candidatus Altiarchaeota archaeon]